MFKPVTISVPVTPADIGKAAAPVSTDGANNVFKVLHGFYGNLFLSKFASGETDAAGVDQGVVSARRIWAYGLREFDVSTVKTALQQCMERYTEFPPSFPQFRALCAANKPREVYRPAQPAIGMGQGLRSRYAAQARAINERHAQARPGRREPVDGLDGLAQAIADAVATAGGDEAAELRRMSGMFRVAEAA